MGARRNFVRGEPKKTPIGTKNFPYMEKKTSHKEKKRSERGTHTWKKGPNKEKNSKKAAPPPHIKNFLVDIPEGGAPLRVPLGGAHRW